MSTELRKALDWAGTQAELARRLRTTRQTVSQAFNSGGFSYRLAYQLHKLNPSLSLDALLRPVRWDRDGVNKR